jgi:hypothetical protein
MKDKWCDTTDKSTKWLMIDLGADTTISRWIVKHAGVMGEPSEFNTSDFKLQKSSDGKDWEDVDSVKDNKDSITNRTITPFTTRYIRLYITKATQTDSNTARVFSIELYGENNVKNSYQIPNLIISEPEAVLDNKMLSTTIYVENKTSLNQDITIVATVYSDKNEMTYINSFRSSVAAMGMNSITAKFDNLPELKSSDKVKIFVWDSLNGMKALREDYNFVPPSK